ncbi:MAG: hypothetical protein C5B48_09150 [Candidatus Rokuibacteriota bacterium]|nr:MAG: hypothetical protein C5B48_09150 [Candidatus Rokubacteria bacterium]
MAHVTPTLLTNRSPLGVPLRAESGSLWERLLNHWPRFWRLGQWGISVCSLLLGLLTLFIFRRGLPHVGWIVGYLLLLWLLVVALAELRAPLEERGRHLFVGASEYAIQTLYHNLLLFVLPAYYASATLDSLNGLFLAAVALAALLTAVDPWYRRLVHPRTWLQNILLALAVFSALNVALPLVGVRPIVAVEGSAVLAVVALTPTWRRRGLASWKRVLVQTVLLGCVALVLSWCARVVVPPAPLFVAKALAARTVIELQPVDPIGASIAAATVAEWGGLAAYTAIYAPSGLHQAIEHRWSRNGVLFARIALSPVHGGRTEGFRTYSITRNLKPPLDGRYTVDAVTASGQLIGRLRFTVTR